MTKMKRRTMQGMIAGGMIGGMMLFGGCGTIMNGTSSMVTINSIPRANVSIDGKKYGMTPVKLSLSHKKNHLVHLEANGYRPYDQKISKSFSAWYLANIIFGGVVGFVIDPISGGMWNVSPKKVEARLIKTGPSKSLEKILEKGKMTSSN